jgi:hypothetical protein
MRDFNSYKPNDTSSNSNNYMGLLKNLAEKYEGASETELISAIVKEAEKGRKNGTLTDSDIDNFVKTLYPLLNANQKRRLDSVISKIKKGQ